MVRLVNSADRARALQWLELAAAHDPASGLPTAAEVCGRAALADVTIDGVTVGAVAVEMTQWQAGREMLILGAAVRAPRSITGELSDVLEAHAIYSGCRAMVCWTARPGLVKRLHASGWETSGTILRKVLA